MNSKDNMNTPQNKNTNNTGNNNRRPGGAPGPVRPMRGLMWALYVIFGIAMIWIVRNYSGSDPVKTEWLTVKESMIPQGDVEKITYVTNLHRAEVYVRQPLLRRTDPRGRPPFLFHSILQLQRRGELRGGPSGASRSPALHHIH